MTEEFECIIPHDVLIRILSYVSDQNFLRTREVNRRWYAAFYKTNEGRLFRRFPKTYKKLRAHQRKDPQTLKNIENAAYQFLSKRVGVFFNAAKDCDEETLTKLIKNKEIGLDELIFGIDQKEFVSPFNIILFRCSQNIRHLMYTLIIMPTCNEMLPLLLWAIRSHQALDIINDLLTSERQVLATLQHKQLNRYLKRQMGRTPLLEACAYGYKAAVHFLVTQGENVRKTDHASRTPLFEACRWGEIEIAEYLLENGAQPDINKADIYKQTPLSEAIHFQELKIIYLLIKNGANITLENAETQEKFLHLLKNQQEHIQRSFVVKMLNNFLHCRNGRTDLYAAKALLKALNKKDITSVLQARSYHAVLFNSHLKPIYVLSEPFLEDTMQDKYTIDSFAKGMRLLQKI